MAAIDELRDLANWKEGLISPTVLFDEDVYRLERERVFGRAWLVVGHEDMIRKPGDYVTNYMGEVPVILTRDMAGKIHVLVNRCAHRGNQVCLFDRGNASVFTCSYHGWTYGVDGSLLGMPMEQPLYRGELNKAEWGLEEVPRFQNFKGLLFASFDAGAPPLEEWLGADGCWWLQNFVLGEPVGGLQALPGWHRYRTPGNWKHLSENFIGDDYHVMAATHVAWFKVVQEFNEKGLLPPRHAYRARRRSSMTPEGRAEGEDGVRYEATTGYGRGCPIGMGGVDLGDSTYRHDLDEAQTLGPEAVEWVQYRYQRLHEVLKDWELVPYGFQNGCIFPNMAINSFTSPMQGRNWILFHPRGPWEFEQWQWSMIEREAPPSVKQLATERAYSGQHMGGTIAPDDVENLERIAEAMRAPRNWRRFQHYGMQLGREEEGPKGLPGNLGPNPSEVNQRNFYRFWLELMERE
jgi:phenylpropionate dioxygenase-like ring-hydroxylating dioxygenase large terminal subunit